MALDKHALSELLAALRAGGDLDLIRSGMQLVLQALIELEATQRIGAEPYQRSPERSTHRNGAASACCRPRPATSSCASPSCVRTRSTRLCWSRADLSEGSMALVAGERASAEATSTAPALLAS